MVGYNSEKTKTQIKAWRYVLTWPRWSEMTVNYQLAYVKFQNIVSGSC